MILTLPFCEKDIRATSQLLEWISELGGCPKHECLLISDAAVPWYEAVDILSLANKAFRKARIVSTDRAYNEPWPIAQNQMFRFAAQHIEDNIKEPFFWLESDAIPLQRNWMEVIDSTYLSSGKLYLGKVYPFDNPNTALAPSRVLSGIAVYPANTHSLLGKCISTRLNTAWDVTTSFLTVPEAHDSNLIHWLWGEPNNPPVFGENGVKGTPVFSIKQLHPEAVIFHRNKDGSLIYHLRRKFFPIDEGGFCVVLHFCNHDSHLMLKNVRWMSELHPKQATDAMLSFDNSTNRKMVEEIKNAAEQVFNRVSVFTYPTPPRGTWPIGPNMAFAHTAHHRQQFHIPWLWLEADAIPLKPDWIERLQREYAQAKKPFMGSKVQGMSHFNGTMIYPANTPQLIPRALTEKNGAWDTNMAPEMAHLAHDAGHLMFHGWGVVRNKIHSFEGNAPTFATVDDVRRWVPRQAVLFHRCKDGTLIDRLREMK